MKKIFLTNRPFETKKLGEVLAKKILKIKTQKKALVLCLEGDLGSGKTTFLKGFAKGLGIKEKILSPTFIIMRKFPIPNSQTFYHIDCYRILKPKELLDLGFKEIISHPKNIIVIEWADHIRKIIPKETIWLRFDFIDKKRRKIELMC